MSIQSIMENNEHKLFFLKAIQLGISYGQSEKSEYYKDKIQNEIYQLMEMNEKEPSIPAPTHIPISETIKKIDLAILALENQKNQIAQAIQQLSNNYAYNYSKINFLKNNIGTIQGEIDKCKIMRNQEMEIIKKKMMEDTIKQKRRDIQKTGTKSKNPENLTQELQNTFSKLSNLLTS